MKVLTFLTIFAGALSLPAQAANIVLNPGFETSSFAPEWTETNASSGTDIFVGNFSPNTGTWAAAFGATTPGFFDTISQTLSTTNGQAYTFSFFLAAEFSGGAAGAQNFTQSVDPVGEFQAFWNGTMVLDSLAGNSLGFAYTQSSFGVVGTGSDTITFKGYNLPAHYSLDDVSVDASTVPEPATWLLMGVGLVALTAFRRRAPVAVRALSRR